MSTSFFSKAVELQHLWSETESQPLSSTEKESIDSAFIRQGQYGKSLIFLMKEGNPRLVNWSTTAPDYPVGTAINVDSIRLTEIKDLDGKTIYRASGEAL